MAHPEPPKRLNVIHPAMAAELIAYFDHLCDRQDVRVVVLQGAGHHFCAGFDLGNLETVTSALPRGLRMQRQKANIVLHTRVFPHSAQNASSATRIDLRGTAELSIRAPSELKDESSRAIHLDWSPDI